MSYRWVVFGVGAAILGGAAWYFGRPVLPLVTPAPKVVEAPAAAPVVAAAPKPVEPVRVIEVIDLARAYEPVREAEPAGDLQAVGYIADPYAPARIPPAADDRPFDDLKVTVAQVATGTLLFGVELPAGERLDVSPRELTPEKLEVTPREVNEAQFEVIGRPAALHYERTPAKAAGERINIQPRVMSPE